MKAEKIRGLESAELQKQLADMGETMFRLRLQMSLGQADGVEKYRETKKDRARILTVLRERAK